MLTSCLGRIQPSWEVGRGEAPDLNKALSTPHFIVRVAKFIGITQMKKCVSSTFNRNNFPHNRLHNRLEEPVGLELAHKRRLVSEDHSPWQQRPQQEAQLQSPHSLSERHLCHNNLSSKHFGQFSLVLAIVLHAPAQGSSRFSACS